MFQHSFCYSNSFFKTRIIINDHEFLFGQYEQKSIHVNYMAIRVSLSKLIVHAAISDFGSIGIHVTVQFVKPDLRGKRTQ